MPTPIAILTLRTVRSHFTYLWFCWCESVSRWGRHPCPSEPWTVASSSDCRRCRSPTPDQWRTLQRCNCEESGGRSWACHRLGRWSRWGHLWGCSNCWSLRLWICNGKRLENLWNAISTNFINARLRLKTNWPKNREVFWKRMSLTLKLRNLFSQ